MKEKLSFKFKTVIPLFIGLIIVYFSINNITPLEKINIKNSFISADYKFIILAVLVGVFSHFIRALRWKLLINPLGYNLSLKNSIMSIFVCFLANLGIPRSGEFLRASLINFYNGIPFDKTLGTIFSERVIDLMVLLTMIFIGIVSYPIIDFNLEFSATKTFLFVFSITLIIFLLIFLFKDILKKSGVTFINNIKIGVFSVFKTKNKPLFLAYTLFIWISYFLMFYISKFCMEETSTISLETIFIAFVAGVIAMTLTNGGLGAYPLAISSVLVQYDISFENAFAFGWIVWTSQTLLIIIFGSLSFIFLPILNK